MTRVKLSLDFYLLRIEDILQTEIERNEVIHFLLFVVALDLQVHV